jgi:hypothetical protein
MNGKAMHDTAMMDAVPDGAPGEADPHPSVIAAAWTFGLALWLAAWSAARAWLRVWWREPAAMAAALGAGILLAGFVARCSIPVRAQSCADRDTAAVVQETCETEYPGRARAQTIGGRWACVDASTGEVLTWWYGDAAAPGTTPTPAPKETSDAGGARWLRVV